MTPLVYSIDDAAEALGGLSRAYVYQLMDAGRLRYAKVGKRRLIRADSVAELIESATVANP